MHDDNKHSIGEKGEQVKIKLIDKKRSNQCTYIKHVRIQQDQMWSGCELAISTLTGGRRPWARQGVSRFWAGNAPNQHPMHHSTWYPRQLRNLEDLQKQEGLPTVPLLRAAAGGIDCTVRPGKWFIQPNLWRRTHRFVWWATINLIDFDWLHRRLRYISGSLFDTGQWPPWADMLMNTKEGWKRSNANC